MKILRTLLLGAACSSSPAMAHAVVKHSEPAHGARLAAAPREAVITFNEKVEKMFTTASLKSGAGAAIATAKARVDPADPTTLRLALPALQSGAYVVKWTAVGHDGHRLSGTIGFSVN